MTTKPSIQVLAQQQEVSRLLGQVISDPSNDSFRLKFAEEIRADDPARADFIEAQQHAALAESPQSKAAVVGIRMALMKHGSRWAEKALGPVSAQITGGWRRGFLERIDVSGADFVQRHWSSAIPLMCIQITNMADVSMQQLLEHSDVRKVRALGLRGLKLSDDDVQLLCESDALTQLKWLDLRDNGLGDDAMRLLLGSTTLQPDWIGLTGNRSRLIPRPGGCNERGEVGDTEWAAELSELANCPGWLQRCAQGQTLPWWHEVPLEKRSEKD